MKSLRFASAAVVFALSVSPIALVAQDADHNALIMDEGLNRSEIEQTAHELVDGIGPRITNSNNMRKAEDWALEKLRELGLQNVRKEGFEFGRGWEVISSDVRMVGPRPI